MAALQRTTPGSYNPDRRSFLLSLAGLGLSTKIRKSEKSSAETVYRFLTPECEVLMSVEYFARSEVQSFRFRDSFSNRSFCLSAKGEEGQACIERFSGSIAIARYRFRSRTASPAPVNMRERVVTIDHDSRMNPRPPFERVLVAEREMISDIQAFGYNPDAPPQDDVTARSSVVWCLLRQDLFLNQENEAFLVVHWKHTLDFIRLVDVIPGDQTQMVSEG